MSKRTQTILVAGGSKGIGLEIARRFYCTGFNVAVTARKVDVLKNIEQQWKDEVGQEVIGSLLALSVDARDHEAVDNLVQEVVNQMGRIDILINSIGGVTKTGKFSELGAMDWSDCFDHNVISMINFCQSCYPFLAQLSIARVINITSVTGIEPGDFNPHYSACKAATINLSKHLANVWGEDNILVNSIAAGPVETEAFHSIIEEKAKKEERDLQSVEQEFIGGLASRIPLARIGSTSDIAALVEFLVSDGARWITGANICIDGGKHKGIL